MTQEKPNWKKLSAEEKISFVKKFWVEGISASVLSEEFDGCTKNGIIGLYDRNRYLRHTHPLVMQGPAKSISRVKSRKPGPKKKPKPKPKPKAPKRTVKDPAVLQARENLAIQKALKQEIVDPYLETDLPYGARPSILVDAKPFTCRFPVGHNGQTSLFCCAPASRKSYCAHHAARAFSYAPGASL